jgi:hypothetical protein
MIKHMDLNYNYSMTTPFFDTHLLIKKLKESYDFSEKQAEGLVVAINDISNDKIGQLATKADLFALKADLAELRIDLDNKIDKLEVKLHIEIAGVKGEIAGVRVEIAGVRIEVATIKSDLIKWMIGSAVAVIGTNITILLKILDKF